MPRDERNLLTVLKFELAFLGSGYRRSLNTPWRAPLVFEGSPTCAAFSSEQDPQHCGECLLLQFVPNEYRAKKLACHYIPLNAKGDTLNSLYHWAYDPEVAKLYSYDPDKARSLDRRKSERDGRLRQS